MTESRRSEAGEDAGGWRVPAISVLAAPRRATTPPFSAFVTGAPVSRQSQESRSQERAQGAGAVLKVDKLVVLGNFNDRVATDNAAGEGVLGPHCLGSSNDNNRFLLSTCAELRLLLINTFYLPTREKAYSMHLHKSSADSCWTMFSFGDEIDKTCG
ncbi:unnamed protein product [Schistocephalus solidus]|uniref:Uncharacterized protein n=1 Tax=Schistocephalus solidus TaxID=70667 RepID=A0A183TP35_SCHSO|nr:unnamed protein product [Schistocephalus solidus]